MSVGKVYILNAVGTSRYKIGKCTQLTARLVCIDTISPFPLSCVALVEVNKYHAVENLMHEKYETQRVHGEWFEFSVEQAEAARVYLISLGKELPVDGFVSANPNPKERIVGSMFGGSVSVYISQEMLDWLDERCAVGATRSSTAAAILTALREGRPTR